MVCGHWRGACSGRILKTILDAQNLAKLHNGKYCSTKIKNVDLPLEWECELGHRWNSAYNTIKQGHWCPCCGIFAGQTKLIKIIKELFPGEQIKVCCRDFEWLVYNGKLEIDIYIPSHKIAIEYDGQQHFLPVRFGGMSCEQAQDNFAKQKLRDDIKNKLMLAHINVGGQEISRFIRFNYKDKNRLSKDFVMNKLGL